MNNINCPKFEDCSAPVCPLQQNAIGHGIWYPDEEICIARKFLTLGWVRKQKAIVKVKAPEDRYFTVEMLEAIKQVRKGIEGISPDQLLEQAKEAERKWIMEKREGRVIANQNSKHCQVTRAKRSDLVAVGGISQQAKGGRK
jgi:hypothetical protein